MNAIPKAVRKAVEPSLEKSANELANRIESLTPVDEGDLRDSVEIQDGELELQKIVTIGDDAAYYARWVEFGTPNTPAQPYFFPAYRLLRKRIEGRIKRAIKKAVRNEWSK